MEKIILVSVLLTAFAYVAWLFYTLGWSACAKTIRDRNFRKHRRGHGGNDSNAVSKNGYRKNDRQRKGGNHNVRRQKRETRW